jgi:arabinan endo-1,5-alpha-L-arabinosidase
VFPDPTVLHANDGYYYAYATGDPLNSDDRDPGGNFIFHTIPQLRSADLVNWTYIGDAFSSRPDWLEPTSGMWAPDVRFINGLYYMYYVGLDPKDYITGQHCGSEPAIGVATSPNPYGPWTDLGQPVVYPRANGGSCNFFWTFDPAVIQDDSGQLYIYYGSYYGGIWARRLSKDGTSSDPASEVQVTIANRYEGTFVYPHGGYYYLFASATDCCRGPLSAYSVFAGRATSPLGPFVDRLGVPLTETRVGGTPVISINGNRWMGPGHNAVIPDAAGQDWFFYHAIDRNDPYLADPNPQNINKRHFMMDRLTWINGWPTVRSDYWASDTPQPAPITGPGITPSATPAPRPIDVPGSILPAFSEEFNGSMGAQWSWVRPPPTGTTSLTENPGYFRFRTQDADLFENNNSASVLLENAPPGDFMVEAKFEFNLPPAGCCFNYRQAGLLVYQDDDQFLKAAHVSIWETRQTEWAKEVNQPIARPARYGNTVLGPPGQPGVITTTTWLRIVKRTDSTSGEQLYTAYSSFNGLNWVRGGTWTHNLPTPKIGLFAMGGSGSIADFDYVHVYSLAPTETATPTITPSGTTTATALPSSTGTATSVIPSVTLTVPATASRTPTGTPTAQPTGTVTATTTPCTIQFSDVTDPTAYYYAPVYYLACHGVVSGYADGTFRPFNNTTRGQMAKIVVLGFNIPLVTPPATANRTFADVLPGDTFYEYIETAAMHQIVSGYLCGGSNPQTGAAEPCDPASRPYYRPGNLVTRGQLTKIVVIAAGWSVLNPTNPTFSDVPPQSTFYEYIETAVCHGIINGYADSTFRPGNSAFRGQIAKIVYLAVTDTTPSTACVPQVTATPTGATP